MVLPNDTYSNTLPPIKWIGEHTCAQMLNRYIWLYNKCILGPLSLQVGDFVLVSNADAREPDTVDGCDIAKILHLYEEKDFAGRDPYGAVVQWYSRPKSLPAKYLDKDDINLDFDTEVIEEHRPYDPNISLEAIFQKCSVLFANITTSACDVLKNVNNKGNYCAVFVCRYKFIKVKNTFRLQPLEFEDNSLKSECDKNQQLKNDNGIRSILRKRRSSFYASRTIRDENSLNNVDEVTPIKVIHGHKVARVSQNNSARHTSVCSKLNSYSHQEINSPVNDSPQCLNYSIVNKSPNTDDLASDLKIKLRLSRRQSHKPEYSIQSPAKHNETESKCGFAIESGNKTPKTPKSSKLKHTKSRCITPNMELRTHYSDDTANKTGMQNVRQLLHVSVVPTNLPCREKEFKEIYNFLEAKLQDQCSGCIYISGLPGTGKTATVTGVIRALQQDASENLVPTFDFIEINGMRLTEPRQAYVHIYKELSGKRVSWEHALTLLQKRFTSLTPRRSVTILLVDELDMLCNRRQDVVYNLLDWPTKVHARLVVVTIANTMDLPERLLIGKVASRLGLTRLSFQPYSYKQLQEIVSERLCGTNAFKADAVQLVARKVAAVSGDARRALDICRRAAEIADCSADESSGRSVNMLHVQQALNELVASAKVQAIKNCSRMEQIFLQAVAAEMERTGVEETVFMDVYTQIKTISTFLDANIPSIGQALRIGCKLGAERLIICENSSQDLYGKIFLNVSSDDLHYALKVDANSNLFNS